MVALALSRGSRGARRGEARRGVQGGGRRRRGGRNCARDDAEAPGRGVAGEAVNGSGRALRAAAYMDAGAPPRGWRGRVLWLVSVEVSCCFDPVRVGGRAGVGS